MRSTAYNNRNPDARSFMKDYSAHSMPPLRRRNLSLIVRGGTAWLLERYVPQLLFAREM